jgi:hypothetical protein
MVQVRDHSLSKDLEAVAAAARAWLPGVVAQPRRRELAGVRTLRFLGRRLVDEDGDAVTDGL